MRIEFTRGEIMTLQISICFMLLALVMIGPSSSYTAGSRSYWKMSIEAAHENELRLKQL